MLEISLALEEERMRVADRSFSKTNSISGTELIRNWKINCNHVRNLWITADGLAIIEKQNRLSVWWNLHSARRNRFREKIRIFIPLKPRTVQPNSHSIGIRRHKKTLTRK